MNVTRRLTGAFGRGRSGVIAGRTVCSVVVVTLGAAAVASLQAGEPGQFSPERATLPLERPTLKDAQSLFYSARYEAAAALTLALHESDTGDLASDELRSSALLFQLKGLLEERSNKESNKKNALKQCTTCPALIAEFFTVIQRGQNLARATLRSTPDDEAAAFFLGKLDLNYVWLQLGPLRKKTGCSGATRVTSARGSHVPGSITS
jgi:hypothetical protein